MRFAQVFAMMLLMVLGGCKNSRPVLQQTTKHDTTYVEVHHTVRDTVFKVDSSSTSQSFDCDSILRLFEAGSKPIQTANNQARLTLSVDSVGRVTAECICDTLAIEAQLRNTYRNEVSDSTTETTHTILQPYTPTWIKVFAWIGGILCAVIIIALIIKFST